MATKSSPEELSHKTTTESPLDPKLSPHCLQNREAHYVDEEFNDATRLLDHDTYPESQYVPTNSQTELTTVHYGRRQLLINEMEFLTLACLELEKEEKISLEKKSIVVIYAGAAHGHHLLVLAEFFPFLKFVLVDSKSVQLRFGTNRYKPNFRFIRQNIDDDLAQRLKKEYDDDKWIRLFMSDIRTDDTGEEQIKIDHAIQKRAHEILGPFMSFLKFRPPYFDKTNPEERLFNYLDGKIYFLIWGRSKTSETRLVCTKDAKTRDYDCQKYENQLYHFNMKQRPLCYKHDVNAGGIDHCYDCRAEVHVLDEFRRSTARIRSLLGKLQSETDPLVFPGSLSQLVERISIAIDSSRRVIGQGQDPSQFVLRLGDQLLTGRYKFTNLRYGINLATVVDFNRYFEQVRLVPLNRGQDDLVAGMANLNV